MASPWKTLPQQTPTDGQHVWVRLNYWFGPPFAARWDEASQTFNADDNTALFYPFWTVSRWKDY